MKIVLIALCSLMMSSYASCKDNPNKSNSSAVVAQQKKLPIIQFEQTEHDFGNIDKNKPVSFMFKFKNTGNAPLVIADAKSSCGCTIPEKPEKAIAPGETGEIKVNYNASGSGQITKVVTLITNTKEGRERLTVKAFVK